MEGKVWRGQISAGWAALGGPRGAGASQFGGLHPHPKNIGEGMWTGGDGDTEGGDVGGQWWGGGTGPTGYSGLFWGSGGHSAGECHRP